MADHPELLAALRRYAENLPPGIDSRPLQALLDEAETAEPPAREWAWARLLVAWPRWRPHRLERLLFPPREKLAALAERCREAASEPEPAAGWRWNPFNRPDTSAADDLRELLEACAGMLDSVAAPLPPETRAALDRAADLGHTVDAHIGELPADWIACRLARADAAIADGPELSPGSLPHFLDELIRIAEAGDAPTHSDQLDALLTLARTWAELDGLTILPADWSYLGGGVPPTPPDGLAVKHVFRQDDPPGRIVRVRSFGLVGADGVVRTGEVVMSAGRPPHGLTELEELAAGAPAEVREELAEAFRTLRPAGADGYLELAAIDLFTRFWDRVHPAWARTNPSAADGFGSGLAALLAETFGLEAFTPSHFRDQPDGWIILPPGTRMTTGCVTRALRPGLISAGPTLRVPARVEVE